MEAEVDFIVGTFSKSLGAIGGFAVSDHPDFDLLRYVARPYMFTASPSPADVAAAGAALAPDRDRSGAARALVAQRPKLHEGLSSLGFLPCADPGPVVACACRTRRRPSTPGAGWWSSGSTSTWRCRPARPAALYLLRCSVSSAHTPEQLDEIIRRFGILAGELNAAGRLAA